LSNINTHF